VNGNADIMARDSNPSASKTRSTNSNSQSQRCLLHGTSFTCFIRQTSHNSAVNLMINRFLQHSSELRDSEQAGESTAGIDSGASKGEAHAYNVLPTSLRGA
jgi:hypothetical protein